MSKKGVLYIKEVIKDVAEELDMSKEEVNEMWNIHVKYLKKLMEREDVYVIKIPKIGNLFFSKFLFNLFNKKSKINKYGHLQEKADKLHKMVNDSMDSEGSTKYTYPQIKRPSIYRLYKSIQWNMFNRNKKYTSANKLIETIENYSKNENK